MVRYLYNLQSDAPSQSSNIIFLLSLTIRKVINQWKYNMMFCVLDYKLIRSSECVLLIFKSQVTRRVSMWKWVCVLMSSSSLEVFPQKLGIFLLMVIKSSIFGARVFEFTPWLYLLRFLNKYLNLFASQFPCL